ncbi:MAG TPA: hypothetical protein VK709_09265 [Candidatus Saccharimonadales bacterium]|nr:hypothetical protein [Candidatus Saccharimonadales bacterium]
MSFSYFAYGLHLCSNLAIARLNESSTSSAVDVQVSLGHLPPLLSESRKGEEEVFYLSPEIEDEEGNPRVVMSKSSAGSYFRIRYGDGAEFLIDEPGTQVWGAWLDKLSLEDVLVFLLGPIMGFVLRQRGLTSLHASAVAIDNRAIVFIGPPGAGKSTTAATFALQGHSVISDDIVPLLDRGNVFEVPSGYPCVCLWPESVKSLYGSLDILPLLTPTWDKRYLPLGNAEHRFQREPLPLGAVYVLGDRCIEPARPLVEPVPAGKALIALVANTYMNYLLDSGLRAREFGFLGKVVQNVPVRKILPHADPIYLTRLSEIIVQDFRSLMTSNDMTHTR